MSGGELSDGIRGRVHKGIGAGSGDLVVGAADFQVEGRDGGIRGRNVGLEIFFGNISRQCLPAFYLGISKRLHFLSRKGADLAMCGEDGSKDRFRIFEGQSGARQKGLEKGPIRVIILCFFFRLIVGHLANVPCKMWCVHGALTPL